MEGGLVSDGSDVEEMPGAGVEERLGRNRETGVHFVRD